MHKPTYRLKALGCAGLSLLPLTVAAQTAAVNGEDKPIALSIHFLITLGILAVVVLAFLLYLRHLQKTFLETCTREKQLALFFQSPAGLPEGTIRGVIAMLIVTASMLFLALPNNQFPDVLGGILGTIIGFYFGARGQNRDSESAALQQAHEATTQRDEAVSQQQQSKTGSMLETVSSGIDMARTVAGLLPKEIGGKYVDLANKVEKGVNVAKGLMGEGKIEDALHAVTDTQNTLDQDGPLTDILGSAVKTFGATLGTFMPPAALIAAVVAGTVKLTGIYYQKWKARILHMPFSPAAGLTLEPVDDNTGFMLLRQSPLFRDAFQAQMENPKFLKDAVNDFIGNADSAELFEKYAELGGFKTLEQFEEGLDEFHRAAADRELKSLILARDPAMFGNTGGYESVLQAVDKLHQNRDALKDLDSLIVVTEKLQAEDKPVAGMINKILEGHAS
ncbi:hypothetical protein A1353_08665 [Methylomonas methanica]|uniref:Uncharacterized protein n=1 Tax=Methylomonas methanica TaxID=421 RepID=A0A177MNR5_METMH|nr:hypothetical protein [Methylomonas methanica]OAI06499.1 hypothetical protein A1353_08665 [Methylomonas methanica]